MTRHYPRGRQPHWQITVATRAGRVVFAAECEDRRECVGLATEARHTDNSLEIWITDPFGHAEAWD